MGYYDLYQKNRKLGINNDFNPPTGTAPQIPRAQSTNTLFNPAPPKAPAFDMNSAKAPSMQAPNPSSFMGSLGAASSVMAGVGALLGGIGSVYDAHLKKKYQEKVFNMEKERVNRQLKRESEASKTLEGVWGK
ncbi:MAG: hypothetical protein ACTTH5_02995 [Wolinella sp.]